MTKKLLSIVLSVSMILSLCTGFVVQADSDVKFTMDFTKSTVDLSGIKKTTVKNTSGEDIVNVSFDSDENAMKIVAKSYASGVQNNATLSIPLEQEIDTSKGTFAITVQMKMPSDNTNPALRGFPILSGQSEALRSANPVDADTIFGLAHMGGDNLLVAANDTDDAIWLRKGYTTGDSGSNYADKAASSSTGGIDATFLGDGLRLYENTTFMNMTDASSKYYYYRWVIDPDTKTFKLYYSEDGKNWTQAYTRYKMLNPYESIWDKEPESMVISRFDEGGVMPTGDLPAKITNFKFRQNNASSAAEKAYYIKSISVDQTATASYVNAETNNMEFTGSSSEYTKSGLFTNGGTAVINTTENSGSGVLQYKPNKAAANNTTSTYSIPLSNPIDTTKGPFSIFIRMKFPTTINRAFRGFPTLSDGTTTNIFGLTWVKGNNAMSLTTENNTDGLWLIKDRTGANAAANGVINNMKEFSTSGCSAYHIAMTNAQGDYCTYRWDIDPASETFRFYYRQSDSGNWTEPYNIEHMANPHESTDTQAVWYDSPGLFPTGTLPEVITEFVFREPSYGAETAEYSYDIDYIKTYQTVMEHKASAELADSTTINIKTSKKLDSTVSDFSDVVKIKAADGDYVTAASIVTDDINSIKATFADELTGKYQAEFTELKFADGDTYTGTVDVIDSGKISANVNSNGITDIDFDGNEIVWSHEKPNLSADGVTYFEYDFEDITLGSDPVEIKFTAKLPANFYRLNGFPNIVDSVDTVYNFGFDTATPNYANNSVEQYLFRNLGIKTMQKGSSYTGTDYTSVKLISPSFLKYGVDTQTYAPTGASAEFYDYKFVIDPVAKEYRYYHKKSTEAKYTEIFEDYPGYPVAITDLPTTISKLKFVMGRNTGNQSDKTAGVVRFKDISVRTLNDEAKTSGFAGRIVDRAYKVESEATLADITAKIINYSSADVADVTPILAVYDSNGKLSSVKFGTKTTLKNGDNTYTFNDVAAVGATWNSSGTYVNNDTGVYKLFVWKDGTIEPLADTYEI